MSKCGDCKSWDSKEKPLRKGLRFRECRRHSPRVVMGMLSKQRNLQKCKLSIFPLTEEFDWCGEFEAKE